MVKKRLTVALVCDAIYPYSRGGREFRYQALLPRLAGRADMHVFTMRWWDGPRRYSEDGITYHAITNRMPMYSGGGRRSLSHALRFALACVRLLAARFDVLDADQIPYLQLFVLRLVATLKGKPLVATWHEVWSRPYWTGYLGPVGWLAWMLEVIAVRLPDHIIAASAETAERIRDMAGGAVSVTTVPNGADLDLIARTRPSRTSCDLIAVGRLIGHKRVDLLLDVVAALHTRGIRVNCRIVGDGPERDALEDQAHRLGISPWVEFRDDVTDQQELYSLIKASKLFVSLSAREGFGMAVLEAIACGVPVLTTSAPDNLAQYLAIRYSLGTVCEPSVHDIASAAAKIILHEDHRYGGHGTESMDPWVADYDWEVMTDRVFGVYATDISELLPAHTAIPVLTW